MTVEKSEYLDMVRYIAEYQERFGGSPSIRELQDEFNLNSTSVVTWRLGRLERLGWIARTPGRARMIKITDSGRSEIGE